MMSITMWTSTLIASLQTNDALHLPPSQYKSRAVRPVASPSIKGDAVVVYLANETVDDLTGYEEEDLRTAVPSENLEDWY